MGGAIHKLQSVQIGVEADAAEGTEVAASRIIVANGRWSRIEEFEEYEEQALGNLARTGRAPDLVRTGLELELREKLAFNQLLMMGLLSGVKGGLTGVGATADKTWTVTPGMATDPNPDTYTIEFEEKSPADVQEMQALYCFCTGFEITAGEDGIPEITAKFVGRRVKEGTKTAALSNPSLQSAAALKFAHYFDATWAALGTTQITGQIYNFKYAFGGNGPDGAFIFPSYYHDARSDLDHSGAEYADRFADIEYDVLHNPASAALVQTEQPLKEAGTLRFVRSELVGPVIGSANYRLRLNGAYYHAADSLQDRMDERNGLAVTHIHLKSAHDPTQDQDIDFEVVNDLAAFP